MAVNPVQFLVASNASILDGTKTITISGGVNASRVFSGTAVFLGGSDNPAEAVSGTAPNGSGISTITLRNNWTQGDISNQSLVAFNTNEGLAEAISNVREIVSNVSAIEDLATQGLIKRIDDNNYEIVNITSLGESLVGANDAGTARSVLGLGSAATKNVGTASGNVMEVGAFGLGTAVTREAIDWNSAVKAGFWRSTQVAGQVNSPDDAQAGWYGVVTALNDSNIHQQVTLPSRSKSRTYIRTMQSGIWSPWAELYHSGNTNFNEFYSTGVGDILASGYAFNTTSCVFNFPINSLSLPNGVTISGTEGFEIADRNTQTLLHNNVTNLVMTARVAPKTLALEVTGLSGFTTGQELVLRSRVGSKITVNF